MRISKKKKLTPNHINIRILASILNSNPVRAAYVTSLEQQISTLREELATVYKTQGQNAQRLLSMTETLREKEELARSETENLRKARDEVAALRRKVEQHSEIMAEKDRTAQVRFTSIFLHTNKTVTKTEIIRNFPKILTDEINTLQLELGQIEERNSILTRDNAKLLQRWLDAKQTEVNKMNEANDFYEDMRSRHQAVLNWRDKSSAPPSNAGDEQPNAQNAEADPPSSSAASGSGNGHANGDRKTARKKDGTKFPPDSSTTLNPNG